MAYITDESLKRPIVLSVCETALGGVGRYQDCLRSLEERGFGVVVLMPEEHIQILGDKAGVRTFRRGGRGFAALGRLTAAFLGIKKEVQPDMVFFNSSFALLPLAVMRLLGDRRPAIYCAHCWAASGFESGTLKSRIVRTIEGRLCGLADLIVNVSAGDGQLACRLGYRGRHIVVENAVDDVHFDGGPPPLGAEGDPGIHLLFVGRFDHQKGLDLLLPAFAAAQRRNPQLRLHLVGGTVRDGRMPDLPAGVTLHGWQTPDRLDAFYRAADALVVPSRWEGLPLVIPEALRNGTPILIANRSGMDTLVEPGATGDVFELDAAAIADCLSGLEKSALTAMRPAARDAYERRFSIDRFSAEMSATLIALLRQRR